TAAAVRDTYGTPTYVYSEDTLRQQAQQALQFPHAHDLTVRFAMKACPNAAIIQIFDRMGVWFDASSGYEVMRAIRCGVAPSRISLSSQEFPSNFSTLYEQGIDFNACSLHQLESFGKMFPGRSCGVRLNPGQGSGANFKTDVGGPGASFGIWHEQIPEIKAIAARYDIKIVRVHTHIGSGSDPAVWQRVAKKSLEMVKEFPLVTTLNLGGGYKVARMPGEKSTVLADIGVPIKKAFDDFNKLSGRALHLEIEPGTYLAANAGSLLCSVQDVVSTGADGFTFAKLDSGMTEILRPAMYGSHHPIVNLGNGSTRETGEGQKCVVVRHCCESGDLMTPAAGEPNVIEPRLLSGPVRIGDLVCIDGAGAYCSSMSAKNYNSFPEAPEVIIRSKTHQIDLIRRKQTLDQIVMNEVPLQHDDKK
ncbi:unnamed protein product, partial [Ectocarpus fasciculatus]